MLTRSRTSVEQLRKRPVTGRHLLVAAVLILGAAVTVIALRRLEPAIEHSGRPADNAPEDGQALAGGRPVAAETGGEIEVTPAPSPRSPEALGPAPVTALSPTDEAAPAQVEFTLRTEFRSGKMLYIGVGGAIDGVVNPTLTVAPNTEAKAVLVNGDGIVHDLFIPEFGAQADKNGRKGKSVEVTFTVAADQAGVYAYYCTLPGHRQAGQEGRLVVGP